MLVDSMTKDQMINEVNFDVCDITHHVVLSSLKKGKVDKYRQREKRKVKPLQKRQLYKKIDFNHTTKNNNLWNCQVHIFYKSEIWNGYTRVSGSRNIRTIFYDWGNAFFIDGHFFQRYKERYLDKKRIIANSGINYFSKSNDVFIVLPEYLGELELNDVNVLLMDGIGKGVNMNHVGVCKDYHPKLQLETNYFLIKTFLGFGELKRSQIESIMSYLYSEIERLKSISLSNIDIISRERIKMKKLDMMKIFIKLSDQYKIKY